MTQTYKHTPEMGEISGFGGGYEEVCQNMLDAGVKWILANPAKDPQYKGFKNVYGVMLEDNPDAKELSKAVVDAADGDCTGAMHQAVISRVLYIAKNGWEKYCSEVVARKEKYPHEQ